MSKNVYLLHTNDDFTSTYVEVQGSSIAVSYVQNCQKPKNCQKFTQISNINCPQNTKIFDTVKYRGTYYIVLFSSLIEVEDTY